MDITDRNDYLFINDSRTMLPGMMLSLKSDIMDCGVAWCRFANAKSESLERPRHRHVVNELHFVLDGRLNCYFPAFGGISVEKGQFVLVPSGVLHSTSAEDPQTEYLVIALSVSSENEAINTVFSPEAEPFSAPHTPTMDGLIALLKTKANEYNFSGSLSTKPMVHSIVLEVVDTIIAVKGIDCPPGRNSAYPDQRAYDIERIVSENRYGQKLRGEDISSRLNLTTRQLNRICNQQLGCSINRYITEIRIGSMKELLRNSCYTIRDIASIFGFTDVTGFIKHFTKYTGISPGRYRSLNGLASCSPDEEEP